MTKKTRTVQVYTDEAVKAASRMTHDDYKAIKHMSKIDLVAYLTRIYQRGFQAGAAKARKEMEKEDPNTENTGGGA